MQKVRTNQGGGRKKYDGPSTLVQIKHKKVVEEEGMKDLT